MALTLEQAKFLPKGTILHHNRNTNADGTPQRWKVQSVKTWKRSPWRVKIGLKYGLYGFGILTEDCLDLVSLP